ALRLAVGIVRRGTRRAGRGPPLGTRLVLPRAGRTLLVALGLTTRATLGLRARVRRAHAGPDAGLATNTAEQAAARLVQNLELSVVFTDTELVECGALRLIDRPTGRLNPFHMWILSASPRRRSCL